MVQIVFWNTGEITFTMVSTQLIFSLHFLSNFPKEFYHWLAVGFNEAQRFSYKQLRPAGRYCL